MKLGRLSIEALLTHCGKSQRVWNIQYLLYLNGFSIDLTTAKWPLKAKPSGEISAPHYLSVRQLPAAKVYEACSQTSDPFLQFAQPLLSSKAARKLSPAPR